MPALATHTRAGPWRLTGETRHRVDWRQRVLLEVQEVRETVTVYPMHFMADGTCKTKPERPQHRWREARPEDLFHLLAKTASPASEAA